MANLTYASCWIRGVWVFLMIMCVNIVVGLTAAAVASLMQLLSSHAAMWIGYLLVMALVGLPFMGWIFEKFADRLPRLAIQKA